MAAQKELNRWALLATAKSVATALKPHSRGTQLRLRAPSRVVGMETGGWRAVLGRLGKSVRLELWLDRYSGHAERKFWAGFYAPRKPPVLEKITKKVSRNLWPTRTFSDDDWTVQNGVDTLARRLKRSEFDVPIFENYWDSTYFGIYDWTEGASETRTADFCSRAVAFFEDVARSLPGAPHSDEQRDVYPQEENRTRVVSHLQRERSRLLAADRKLLDKYKCQVCGFRFQDDYGRLGEDFAEAHHRVPLAQLHGRVKTTIDDLGTVCANCHRMLHKMAGEREDIAKLRAIVRNMRAKQRVRAAA